MKAANRWMFHVEVMQVSRSTSGLRVGRDRVRGRRKREDNRYMVCCCAEGKGWIWKKRNEIISEGSAE